MASNSHNKNQRRLAITTGDPDGIGLEVTQKALGQLGPKGGNQFFLYRHSDSAGPLKIPRFKKILVHSLEEAVATPFEPSTLVEIASDSEPGRWVEDAAKGCLTGRLN